METMNKTTNTAASVLKRMEQLKGEFDATDTRPRARVKDGSVEIFKREKSSESLGERVVNHLTRQSQRANAVKLVEAVLKDVESILSPLAGKDIAIQSALKVERDYLRSVRPTNNGMRKTLESLETLLKANMAESASTGAPTRAPTRAPKSVRPRLQTRPSKATRPAWAGKGPSTVAGRTTDTPALSKTTPPKMTKRSAVPSGRAAVATTAQGNAVPARSPGKAQSVAPLRAAAPDLASQWPAVKTFAAQDSGLDWAELLSHVVTSPLAELDHDGEEIQAHKTSTAMTRAGVQAFQKFLRKVDGMTPEGIDAECKKLNAKGKKSAEEFTAAEKIGISRFASKLVANPAVVAPFPWVPGVLAIAKIVVAEPAPPSTRVPRPVR
jgi:hypothetical protein